MRLKLAHELGKINDQVRMSCHSRCNTVISLTPPEQEEKILRGGGGGFTGGQCIVPSDVAVTHRYTSCIFFMTE